MKQLGKRIIAIVSAVAMVVTMLPQSGMVYAAETSEATQSTQYEIYPNPHEITYAGSNFVMSSKVNVVYEEGIDSYTEDRLEEVLALKSMTATTSSAVQTGNVLNILVGIKGSEGYVDEYVSANYSYSDTLFDELDSYFLAIDNGTIVVLGKDTDAAFYGLTSLYHIFTQVESRTIENLEMEDYADVASRGFIEGYYGNPWSTEDRCNLMEWGGYYKLNSYFYAPKDDPKHNANWRELYTPEEIETKIKPLAEAGNASKCRFVYALHPYMHNAISYSSDEAYQADLEVMQAKFAQVIEAGVRQIAILADDAGNVGGANYTRTLQDMTAWIQEMQKTYPDLKLLLPFCTQEYMYNGESYYSDFPENIQIVMTGGRIWGECSDSYTTTFMNNVGRGVYLWINWPCTDNSKKHLIMGGYSTFLHPGVDPDKVQGIVLNPMQQSEPSKVAIFGNACYTWNIWETAEEADQAWEDSFDHVDHKSYEETAASIALKELSKHMINQNMDSRVTALQESVVLKDELNSFKDALNAGTVTKEAVDSLIEEFEILQNASVTYRNQAGDTNLRDQIVYWLNCWDDTTTAAIAYLNAVNAYLENDSATLVECYSEGQTAFAASKTYGFHYVDHTEYAEVGVQHIVPFIKELGTFLANEVKLIADPNTIVAKYISNRYTTPAVGDVESAFDGNDNTSFYFTNPNQVLKDDYIGVSYNRGITVNSIRILMGANKNQMLYSKLQYLVDEENAEWTDIEGAVFERSTSDTDAIEVTGLNLENVKAVRLIATADHLYANGNPLDSWLEIKSIDINREANSGVSGDTETTEEAYTGTISYDGVAVRVGEDANLLDDDASTEVQLAKSPYEGDDRDTFPAGASITLTFAEAKTVGRVEFYQGASKAGDVLSDAKLQYQISGTDTWVDAGAINSATEQTINLGAIENVIAIRIYNNTVASVWARIGGIKVYAPVVVEASKENVYTDVEADIYSQELTDTNGMELTAGSVTLGSGNYIGIKFANNKELMNVAVAYTEANDAVKLQASQNAVIWTDITAGTQNGVDACYIRLVNTGSEAVTLNLTQFAVEVFEIGERTFHSSDIAVISSWGDDRENGNAFDGNMSTVNKLGGRPYAGQYVIYDLGQSIDINSLRVYIADSNTDYIRDAVVQVSADLNTWTDLFTIGDGVTDTDADSTALDDPASYHVDSNYPNYLWAGSDELSASGRYLRIVATVDFPQRAMVVNEIIINNGEYTGVESNKDFVGTLEEEGHRPSYLTDGNLTTTYKPSAENGSMTYRLSENQEGISTVRIIQNGSVSNASVKLKLYNGTGTTEVEVGKLGQALNEFIIPEGLTVLEVTVEWSNAIPEIAEIIKCRGTSTTVDKTELNEALSTYAASDNWIDASKADFEAKKAVAQEIAEGNYYGQLSIDSITGALKRCYENAEIRINDETMAALQSAVANTVSNNDNVYTEKSYAAYTAKVEEIKALLETELTQEEAEELLAELEAAKAGLKYSQYYNEEAAGAIQNDGTLASTNYTESSYQAYAAAKAELQALLDAGNADPLTLKAAKEKFEAAKAALVLKSDEPTTPTDKPTETPTDKPGDTSTDTTVDIAKAQVALAATSMNYTGKALTPAVTVKVGTAALAAGTDYTVTYKNNINIGKASVVITGTGKYTGTVTVEFNIVAKKGATFTSGANKYKVTSASEVSFTGLKSSKTKKVKIPSTVKYGGKTFKVTAIANKALNGKSKVTSVTIGANVKTIGTAAFKGCKALKSITVPGKMTSIGKEAFRNCSKLSKITIKSSKLKSVGKNAFKGIKSNAKISVPKKKVDSYKKMFKKAGVSKKVKITK